MSQELWHTLRLAICAAVGVITVWGTLHPRKLAIYDLSGLIDPLKIGKVAKIWIKCLTFVLLGTAVSQIAVRPKTAQESLIAGIGWMSLVIKPDEKRIARSRKA